MQLDPWMSRFSRQAAALRPDGTRRFAPLLFPSRVPRAYGARFRKPGAEPREIFRPLPFRSALKARASGRLWSACCSSLLLAFCAVFASSARAEDSPNTPPPGFATFEESRAAVLSGKVPLVKPPAEVPPEVEEIRGIEYGNVGGRALLLDLYRPKAMKKPAPGLVFVHGGGWSAGDRQDYRVYVIDFARRGYVAATVSYRLSGEAKFPAAVEDVKCAIRWMRANAEKYMIDETALGVIGGSAGGHLSLMAGYTAGEKALEGSGGNPGVSSEVHAVIDFYGPADLTTEYARNHAIPKAFIGGTYEEKREAYELASPIRHVDSSDPPTLILHGTIDELVPVEQSDQLVAALKAARVPVAYERIEGWPHTMDMAASMNAYCQRRMSEFLSKYLPASR